MDQAKRCLGSLADECCARNDCAVSDSDEDLISRLIFPGIARGKAEATADIVKLRLNRELHIGNKVDDRIERQNVDVHAAGGFMNKCRRPSGDELKIGIGAECDLQIAVNLTAIIEAAAHHLPIDAQ